MWCSIAASRERVIPLHFDALSYINTYENTRILFSALPYLCVTHPTNVTLCPQTSHAVHLPIGTWPHSLCLGAGSLLPLVHRLFREIPGPLSLTTHPPSHKTKPSSPPGPGSGSPRRPLSLIHLLRSEAATQSADQGATSLPLPPPRANAADWLDPDFAA